MTLLRTCLMRSLVIGFVAGCLLGRPLIAARAQSPRQAEPPKANQETKGAEKKVEAKKKVPGLPLKPDRTVAFTTTEGTWISLDVAPDGKTILFELLGDLYTLPIAGGEAKAITTGMAFDSQPRYSPDGKTIAFVTDRDGAENLWVAAADGSDPRPLTKDKQSLFTSPWWTPEGDYVLVSRQTQLPWDGFELWMYHVRGGSGVQVTKGKTKPDPSRDDYVHAIGAVASKDGRFLYYTVRPKLFNAYNNLDFPLSQVARRDRTTGDVDTITEAPGSAFRPMLSPDGSKLVYGTRVDNQTGLRIRELSTGEERWLKLPIQRDEQESRFTRDLIPGYAFTPDSRSVLAAYGGKIHRIDVQSREDRGIPFSVKVSQPVGSRLNFPLRVERWARQGAVDPGAGAIARRQAFGVLGADPAFRHGSARRQAAQANEWRRARVSPELVARRQVARLRELGARGGPHLEAVERRPGRARADHAVAGLLSRPGVLARRQADRGAPRSAP